MVRQCSTFRDRLPMQQYGLLSIYPYRRSHHNGGALTIPASCEVCRVERCVQWRAPLGSSTDRHRQTPKLCKKPLSQFIIAPRAQASRRCETQASLSGKAAKLWLAFRSLDLFRALREPDHRRRDEKRPCRSEQKTATNQNDYLTGKAPYKSETMASGGLHRAGTG